MGILVSTGQLKQAIDLIERGIPIDTVSIDLDWKNFENLVAKILLDNSFDVVQNLIFRKPRMEIDIIGTKSGMSLIIDCKHWKKYSNHNLKRFVEKQIIRTEHYISDKQNLVAIPLIVTLYENTLQFINSVPIVPVFKFSLFVSEVYDYLERIKIIK